MPAAASRSASRVVGAPPPPGGPPPPPAPRAAPPPPPAPRAAGPPAPPGELVDVDVVQTDLAPGDLVADAASLDGVPVTLDSPKAVVCGRGAVGMHAGSAHPG
jgi:hypothetical protein